MVRLLGPGDEAALERFLIRHADSSMFLRSNARTGGLVDGGEPQQGTYAAVFEREADPRPQPGAADSSGATIHGGEITGVAAHYWNDNVVVQLPVSGEPADRAVQDAVAASGRPVGGIIGPSAQVTRARAALNLADRAAAMDSVDDLFALDLDQLALPEQLRDRRVVCRHPRDAELQQLAGWRLTYCHEVLGSTVTPELAVDCRAQIDHLQERGDHWVLEAGGAIVSYTAFNARLPDLAQIGGVWTPHALRGHGYATAVVAGQLVAARAAGVRRAVLFTERTNTPARAAYTRCGFQITGDYKLLLF